MPKVSFYLRNEDVAKWKRLEHKTEFIHAALNNTAPRVIQRAVEFGEAIAIETAKINGETVEYPVVSGGHSLGLMSSANTTPLKACARRDANDNY